VGEDERVDGGVDGLCAHAKSQDKDKDRGQRMDEKRAESREQRAEGRGQRTGGQRAATRAWRRWVGGAHGRAGGGTEERGTVERVSQTADTGGQEKRGVSSEQRRFDAAKKPCRCHALLASLSNRSCTRGPLILDPRRVCHPDGPALLMRKFTRRSPFYPLPSCSAPVASFAALAAAQTRSSALPCPHPSSSSLCPCALRRWRRPLMSLLTASDWSEQDRAHTVTCMIH
jgi:hypothetical protein